MDDPGALQIVHELAYGNLSLGVVGVVTSLFVPWGILGALPGAIYLGLAEVRHSVKRGKGREENVATWTDLLVFCVVVAGALAVVSGGSVYY